MATVLEQFRSNYSATQAEEMGIEEFLDLCRREPATYASAAERMIAGIGEPELVDTRNDPRLGRIFGAPQPVDEVFGRHTVDEMLGLRRRLLGAPARVADAASMLLRDSGYDLAWLTFCAAHVAGHQQRRHVLVLQLPIRRQQDQDRQSGECDQGEACQANGGLDEEDPSRAQWGDQQEFEGLALGQLRQPPAEQCRPLDDAEDQQQVAEQQ